MSKSELDILTHSLEIPYSFWFLMGRQPYQLLDLHIQYGGASAFPFQEGKTLINT